MQGGCFFWKAGEKLSSLLSPSIGIPKRIRNRNVLRVLFCGVALEGSDVSVYPTTPTSESTTVLTTYVVYTYGIYSLHAPTH